MDNKENQDHCFAHSGSLTDHLKKLNMLAKIVMNDFQINIIVLILHQSMKNVP